LEAADVAFMAAHPREWTEEQDPLDWLWELLEPVALEYLDGSRPDFRFDSLMRLWAWALVQYRLLPAILGDRYGRSG
jgi:hypothetical protein